MNPVHGVDTWKDSHSGITLKRYFVWEPDELGTRDYWANEFARAKDLFPYPEILDKYTVWIQHYDHKDLFQLFLDFDPNKDGNQKADGLTNDAYDRSALCLKPDDYYSWPESQRFPTPNNPRQVGRWLSYIRKVFWHEFGHHILQESKFVKGTTEAQKLSRSIFMALYDIADRYDPENISERGAESFVPLFGPNSWRDRYNDEVDLSLNLHTFLRHLYFVCTKTSNVTNLIARDTYTAWTQLEGWWWWQQTVWYKIDLEWKKWKWNGNQWTLEADYGTR